MKRSISVFQVLQDCLGTLESAVTELLEVLPELTSRFDILLIDAGSTDETFEAARDLARSYPQVRIVRQPLQPGLTTSLRKALTQAQGEVILLRDEHCEAEIHDLRKLWRLIDEYAAVIGRAANQRPAAPQSWAQKLCAWGLRRGAANGGAAMDSSPLQLLHRQVADRLWTGEFQPEEMAARLSRSGYRWTEIEVRRSGTIIAGGELREAGAVAGRIDMVRADQAVAGPSEPKRSRRLERLKRFALEE